MDNATAIAALQSLRALVRHWRDDVRAGLRPTVMSLDDAEAMISATLQKEHKK